ncbi:hypothetical protein BXZ70DRAFT_964415 [Cristinia sonorae]|uniref:DUF6699 domain-containing protein n=1 Tax=Cristinia sonorae TaxID=1940300 RepID=A0A8K0XJH5_9AGAR|nr:hypothetical protein BXZ70DRAFT_964415 [Cristinia sonorae]
MNVPALKIPKIRMLHPTKRDMIYPIELCPWLVPNPADRNTPHIKWDMALPPTSAKRRSGTGIVTSLQPKLKDIATHPPVKHLHITIPTGPVGPTGFGVLAWESPSVVIKQSTDITCGDVMFAIYDFLNEPLAQEEVVELGALLKKLRQQYPHTESLEYSARERAKVSMEIGALKGGPYRRVDCMGTMQRFFAGMSLALNDDGTRFSLMLYGRGAVGW